MRNDTPINPDSELWKAWLSFKETPDFHTSMIWARHDNHRLAALWAAFLNGYNSNEEAPDCSSRGLVVIAGSLFLLGLGLGSWLL